MILADFLGIPQDTLIGIALVILIIVGILIIFGRRSVG